MAKTDESSSATGTAEPTFKAPRLGERITVKASPDRKVPNNEAGDYFNQKDAVSVTVDLRILRLLRDEDLIRVADKK